MPQVSSPPSDLVALVAAEARLDQALADARARAAAMIETARHAVAGALLDDELARQRDRITAEIETATKAHISAIADKAREDVTRCAALAGPALEALAHELGLQLIAVALDEVPR